MEFEKIEITALHPGDEAQFLALYEEAFPPEERRVYSGPEALRDFISANEGLFRVAACYDAQGKMAAFLSYWLLEGVLYGEHFAVRKELRGQNLGGRMLEWLQNSEEGKRMLLEVELPEDEMSCRRIGFYERHGFRTRPEVKYVQPAYAPGLPEVPMLLMTYGDVDLSDGRIVGELRRKVYRVQE